MIWLNYAKFLFEFLSSEKSALSNKSFEVWNPFHSAARSDLLKTNMLNVIIYCSIVHPVDHSAYYWVARCLVLFSLFSWVDPWIHIFTFPDLVFLGDGWISLMESHVNTIALVYYRTCRALCGTWYVSLTYWILNQFWKSII